MKENEVDLETPWYELPAEQREVIGQIDVDLPALKLQRNHRARRVFNNPARSPVAPKRAQFRKRGAWKNRGNRLNPGI